MNAPQVYAIRLRKPAEPCALSVSWRSSATDMKLASGCSGEGHRVAEVFKSLHE